MIRFFHFLFCLVFSTNVLAQNDEIPKFYGVLSDEEVYKKVPEISRLSKRSYTNIPKNVSLKEFCPIAGVQKFSDCVGWSTTYAARTILFAIRNNEKNVQVITEEAFSPSFTYSQIKINKSDINCIQGTYIDSGLRLLKNLGSIKNKDLGYECSPFIDNLNFSKASKFKIKEYKRLTENSINPDRKKMIETIKKSLSEKRPVIVSFDVYSSFQNLDFQKSTVFKELWDGKRDKLLGKHALTVIGYSDEKHGGAFEVLNSWGTKWGAEGFLWIKYEDFAVIATEAYEMVDEESFFYSTEPKPLPNPKSLVSNLSGNLKILLENNKLMPLELNKNASRDFKIVEENKSTYYAPQPYSTGTKFRLIFENKQPAFVYVIGFGTNSQKATPIFPFEGFSPYLDYSLNEVMIPDDDFWIELDDKIGIDYLCILYSKEEIDINMVCKNIEQKGKKLIVNLKNALKNKLIEGSKIKFENNEVKFDAKNVENSVIPIIIEINHID
jgi:Papain family cysteine protease/Domain of unknown function (DUF4384)